jgi:uncharacterized membrane protein
MVWLVFQAFSDSTVVSIVRVCAQDWVWIKTRHSIRLSQKDEAFATVVKYMSKEEGLYNVRIFALLNYEASITTFIDWCMWELVAKQ